MHEFFEQILSTDIHPLWLAAIAILSYFIGNINPAIILGKIYGVDVRSEGSGNAGTTNALRTLGKKSGIIVFAVDVLKGLVVTLLTIHFVTLAFGMICGTCVILGHLWPVVFGFRGGKGVATTFGVMLAVEPLLALLLIFIVAVTVGITRMVSLGVCIAAIFAALFGVIYGAVYSICIVLIAVLVLIKHRSNIKRIFKGAEAKLSFGTRDKGGKQ